MASIQERGRGGRAVIVGINVTPMVDVVLVLLVIMMVSATYIVSQSLKVELPKTATSDEATSSPLAVTIDKDDGLTVNGQTVTEADLSARFREAKAGSPDVSLVLNADANVRHGKVVHVIDLAKVEGISKFAIHVEREK